ncbi:MAG: glutamate--cysteine ligase [Pseudomonadota bacterium]
MGIEIDKTAFSADDFALFSDRLHSQLLLLKDNLLAADFGKSSPSIGAEVELYIVDNNGLPSLKNEALLSMANDGCLTHELNKYNLEYNLPPCKIDQQPFSTIETRINNTLSTLNDYAKQLHCRIVPIGILPTLTENDLGFHCLTPGKRYRAFVDYFTQKRGDDFLININGKQSLKYHLSDITLEGANTSLQIHYQVSPEKFVDTYNTVQLVTPLVLAVAANSPTLFGHPLWDETRIPLFKHSIDTRHIDRYQWNEPSRVNFGHGWLRKSAYELFSEAVQLYPPILPICTEQINDSKLLPELCLHLGTVWLWNRPVYDGNDRGHLRIEMRALPSGPTSIDMSANAAFFIGLAEGYRHLIEDFIAAIPFQTAEYNFYRGAQYSFDAELIWPKLGGGYHKQAITHILEESLSVAKSGLLSIGIQEQEANYYLSVIEERIYQRKNAANWQTTTLEKINQTTNQRESLHKMLELFIRNSQQNIPVSQWP